MNRMLAAVCLSAAVIGCGGRAYDGEQRFPLSGKVTVDGEPMEIGVISFLPQDKTGRVSGGPIKNGTYSVPEERGANTGTYRVEIHWSKRTGKQIYDAQSDTMIDQLVEGLPSQYHAASNITVEVGPGKTTFDFDTKSGK